MEYNKIKSTYRNDKVLSNEDNERIKRAYDFYNALGLSPYQLWKQFCSSDDNSNAYLLRRECLESIAALPAVNNREEIFYHDFYDALALLRLLKELSSDEGYDLCESLDKEPNGKFDIGFIEEELP